MKWRSIVLMNNLKNFCSSLLWFSSWIIYGSIDRLIWNHWYRIRRRYLKVLEVMVYIYLIGINPIRLIQKRLSMRVVNRKKIEFLVQHLPLHFSFQLPFHSIRLNKQLIFSSWIINLLISIIGFENIAHLWSFSVECSFFLSSLFLPLFSYIDHPIRLLFLSLSHSITFYFWRLTDRYFDLRMNCFEKNKHEKLSGRIVFRCQSLLLCLRNQQHYSIQSLISNNIKKQQEEFLPRIRRIVDGML